MTIIDFGEARQRLTQSPTAPSRRLSALLPLWLREREDEDNKRPRGVEAYDRSLRRFLRFAGDLPVGQVTPDLVEQYRDSLMERVGPGMTRNELTALESFYAWCVAKGHVATNPATPVEAPQVLPPDPDPLTREHIKQLLQVLDIAPRTHQARWQRTRRAVFLMLYAGLRLTETAGLEWRDIDLKRRTINVRQEVAKGGKPRVVPINDALHAELSAAPRQEPTWAVVDQGETEARQGKPLTYKSLAHLFERWLPMRGVHIHAHQLRKTFATELYNQGEDIVTIQRLLGHSDPKTTIRYIGANSLKEHQAVNRLQFDREDDK